MIPTNRFNPAKPLCAAWRNKIMAARPEDVKHFTHVAEGALNELYLSSPQSASYMSEVFYDANPFSANPSDLALACWAQAVRDKYLELTGGKVEGAAPKVDPMDAWPPDRINATRELFYRLRAGRKIVGRVGCNQSVIYEVLSADCHYSPATRAKWLERIEKAVLELEGVKGGEPVRVPGGLYAGDEPAIDTAAAGETLRWLDGMVKQHRVAEIEIRFRLAQGEVRR
jgi:hypothetical protein